MIDRRTFLVAAAAAGATSTLEKMFAAVIGEQAAGYGPLAPVPSSNSGELLLSLPPRFQYSILDRPGDIMSDGRHNPRNPDGMAAFASADGIRLVRNHEIDGLFADSHELFGYDPRARGGVVVLTVNPDSLQVTRSYLALTGTVRNCAGGATPWGSWISCEETLAEQSAGYERTHGYCFEVPSAADAPTLIEPLRAMGRFVHEAVAVDPRTGFVYLTEDREEAGFYRFVPQVPGDLRAGTLQMLAVSGVPAFDGGVTYARGSAWPVSWVTISRPDPAPGEPIVYSAGRALGGARFRRLEGAAWSGDAIMFTSTSGGNARAGQVWQYRPPSRSRLAGRSPQSAGTLTLLFDSPGESVLLAPDNICLTPRGDLVLCEDPVRKPAFIRLLHSDGSISDFAKNITPGLEQGEFAGATFSPDGRILFVNLYANGMTVAITGPF